MKGIKVGDTVAYKTAPNQRGVVMRKKVENGALWYFVLFEGHTRTSAQTYKSLVLINTEQEARDALKEGK